MILFFLIVLTAGAGQVVSLTGNLNQLINQFDLVESGVSQEELANLELELSEIDPSLYLNRQNEDKSIVTNIISDVIVAFFARERRNLSKRSNFPTLVATNISEQCLNDSIAYHQAYLLRVDWAKQMYESTGKFPEALYYSGNLHGQGLFDECLSVQADWTNTSFQGKYCTVFFDSDLVMPWELEEENPVGDEMQRTNWVGILQVLEWLYNGPKLKQPKVRDTDLYSRYLAALDYCIPSSCTAEDFRLSIAQLIGSRAIDNTTYNDTNYYTSMVAINDDHYCYTAEQIKATPNFDGPDIAVIVTLSILGLVILIATVHDLWFTYYKIQTDQPKKVGLPVKALRCFSMLTNGKKLLSTKSAAVDNLACLNGMRVLSTTWIVLYHTYYEAIINPMYNPLAFLKDALTWQLHGVLNGTIAVDTFFLMSGLLVTYSLLRELDRNKGRFNVALFYLHRFLRLTPVYAVILGFIATLLAYLGSGPNWQNVRDLSMACRWNWWNNLLYVNNYVRTFDLECMGETWYLACDMQMFILSPLFIYPLWRWRKIGLSWAIFNILGLIGGTIAIFIVWNLPAMGFFTRPNDTSNPHYYYGYYVQTWTRFPPYILGILLGWILHRTKNSTIKMNKGVVAACWFFATLIGLAVVYGMVPYLNELEVPEMNDVARVSYGSLHRFAWATVVAWIVFACIHGYGGFINRFLSWKAFIPLARLTYVVYLVHLNYLIVYHAYIRKPYYYTKFTHAEHYFGVLLMVFFMAFAISLTVEVPLLNLEKLLISPTKTRKIEKPEMDEHKQTIPRVRLHTIHLMKLTTNLIDENLIGKHHEFDSPFGKRQVVYCDYTASGKPLQCIESFIMDNVLPTYGNTHTTTSITSVKTTRFRDEAREIIRHAVGASHEDAVIFVGSGCTGAVNKLVAGLHLAERPIIFVGASEHHSNLLPWRAIASRVIRIKEDSNGLLDTEELEASLKMARKENRKMIGCFSAASNITGTLYQDMKITAILHRHGALSFWDYATAAPYVKIAMNPESAEYYSSGIAHKDAIYFSMHKFVGGVQTPGVLVVKKSLMKSPVPTGPGGGTVLFVDRHNQVYAQCIEIREEGGTPAIVENIRAGLVMKLKENVTSEWIMAREEFLAKLAFEKWGNIPELILLGSSTAPRLSIFSFVVRHLDSGYYLHHNFISALLNDIYGIQARGGCACAGPHAQDLLGIDESLTAKFQDMIVDAQDGHYYDILRPGFTRLNLPYFAHDSEIDYIIKAVIAVAKKGWTMLPYYEMNTETGEWHHQNKQLFPFVNDKLVANVDFHLVKKSTFVVDPEKTGSLPKAIRYNEFLRKGEEIFKFAFENSSSSPPPSTEQQINFNNNVKANELRWFLFPNEVGRKLFHDKVPFTPRQYDTCLTPADYHLEHYSTIPAESGSFGSTIFSVKKFY